MKQRERKLPRRPKLPDGRPVPTLDELERDQHKYSKNELNKLEQLAREAERNLKELGAPTADREAGPRWGRPAH